MESVTKMTVLLFLFGCLFVIQSPNTSAQEIKDGISFYPHEDKYIDFQVSTSSLINHFDAGNKSYVSIPFNLRFVVSPQTCLKGEFNVMYAAYISDITEGFYGVGAVWNYGLRYDDILSSEFHYSVRLGMQQIKNVFRQVEFAQLKPDFYFDFIQGYELAKGLDLIANQGIIYIPVYKKVIPTFIVGLRFGSVWTFGVDISSFFLSSENNFMKMRGLF